MLKRVSAPDVRVVDVTEMKQHLREDGDHEDGLIGSFLDTAIELLDAQGEVIAVNDLAPFKNLMTVSGKGATEKLPELAANLMAEPSVYTRVVKAVRVGGRRWDLTLDNKITVKLPEEDLGLSFRRLAQAQEDSALLDKDITAIDLREVDRMAVRAKSGRAQDYVRDFVSSSTKNNKAGNNI